MDLTLETGFIVRSQLEKGLALEIINRYKTSHIQLGDYRSDLIDVTNELESSLGRYLEYSVVVAPDKLIDCFLNNIRIESPSKFMVMPLKILQSLEHKAISSFEFFDYMFTHHPNTFLCIDVNVDKNDTSISANISSLLNIKEAHPNNFLLYSLNFEDLKNISKLKQYTKELKLSIGMVKVRVGESYLNTINDDDEFVELIDTLYWLPYKQQPLIWSNEMSELPQIYRRFFEVVKRRGYSYY